jgi:hypothetical protein
MTQPIIWTAADLPIRAAVGSEYLIMTPYEDTQ